MELLGSRRFALASAVALVSTLLTGGSPANAAEGKSGCCRIYLFGTRTLTCSAPTTEGECQAKAPGQSGTYCLAWVEGATCDPQDRCVESGHKFVSHCVSPEGVKGAVCETAEDCPAGHECRRFAAPNFSPASTPSVAPESDCGCGCEEIPPACTLVARRKGPPAQIDIRVQDSESGLRSVEVLLADNASVAPASFTVGTTAPLTITATKLDQTRASRVELRVTDVLGNVTLCDPVLTEEIRVAGRPTATTFTGLPAAEDTVEITNGSPGLRKLEVAVNGVTFRAAGLRDGEVRTLDVSSAMLPGDSNLFTLHSYGKPGASAMVLIWEGANE